MEKVVSATEAGRRFAKLLRAVRQGESYVVTSPSKAVAKILPVEQADALPGRARAVIAKRFRSEAVVTVGRWSRSEVYEDYG